MSGDVPLPDEVLTDEAVFIEVSGTRHVTDEDQDGAEPPQSTD